MFAAREGEGEQRAWANTGMGPLWLLLQLQLSVPLAARGPGQAPVWKWYKALTSEGKRGGTSPGAEPSSSGFAAQCSSLPVGWWADVFTSPASVSSSIRGSGSLHFAACENYNVSFSKLKTFAHSFHIYVLLLLNFIEVKHTVECVKYTNLKYPALNKFYVSTVI